MLTTVMEKFTNANIGYDIATQVFTLVPRVNLHHLPEFEAFYKKVISTDPETRLFNMDYLDRATRLFNVDLFIQWFSSGADEKYPELTKALL